MTDFELVKEAVHTALNERDGLDRETHRVHHDYLRRRLTAEEARDRRRAELHDKIKATVIGGLVLVFLTAAGTALYNIGRFVIQLYTQSPPPPH